MVSRTLAEAILSQRAPDIVGSFERGREKARQEQIRTLTGEVIQAGGGEKLKELQGIAPEVALALGERLGSRSAKDLNDFIRDAGILERQLLANDIQGAKSFVNLRSDTLRQQNRSSLQTDEIGDLLNANQFDEALRRVQGFTGEIDKAKKANRQSFAPITLVNEETGEERLVIPGIDPGTGEASLEAADIPPGFRIQSKRKGAEEAKDVKLAEEQAKQSTKLAGEAFTQLGAVRKSIVNIDDAIAALDKGAKTGAIERFLPTIRTASIELQNIAGRMGLDIVGAATFGALSESELAFALDVALPTGLDEAQLREWLVRKKAAQDKVRDELQRNAVFLSKGGTVGELVTRSQEQQGVAAVAPEAVPGPGVAPAAPAPVAAPGQQQNIAVDF